MTKKDEGSKQGGSHEKHDNAIAARRARLRSSLAKQSPSSDAYNNKDANTESKSDLSKDEAKTGAFIKKSFAPEASYDKNKVMDIQSALSRAIEAPSESAAYDKSSDRGQQIVLLNNIDQALNSCTSHLASLQKVADNQIEELKLITDTLKHRTFAEVASELNNLVESLTAAIEPMKAIGELVPVLDRLVNVTELKDQIPVKNPVPSAQLAINLANQLLVGNIEPATFKSAYQAIYPDEDVSALTRRLGELLGEEQLSGNLYRAAFQALHDQSELDTSTFAEESESVSYSYEDEEEEINRNAEAEFQLRIIEKEEELIREFAAKEKELDEQFTAREEELTRQLIAKEKEVESFRGKLDSQWQELVSQCEELKSALQEREDILRAKEAELNKKINELMAKDSENQQLRIQIEQLSDETKAMMTDLQKQLMQKNEAQKSTAKVNNVPAQAPAPGFFDFVGTDSQSNDLFTSMSKSPTLFSKEESESLEEITDTGSHAVAESENISDFNSSLNVNTSAVPTKPISNAASSDGWYDTGIKVGGGFASVTSNPASQVNVSDKQPIANTNPAASFVSAAGSYGSGVRAQVFEVIVRQALAGTQWKEICAVPMQSNNISPEEVETEVKRRQALLKK